MGNEQPLSGIIEREFFHALKLGDPLQLPAARWYPIHIVRIRRLGVAQYIKPSAVGGRSRFRYFEAALGDGPCRNIRRLCVQLSETGFFGFIPERAAVREPAKFVESPA